MKNKNLIKKNILSELVGQVNRNCLFNCYMSGPCELGNRNTCHLSPAETWILWIFNYVRSSKTHRLHEMCLPCVKIRQGWGDRRGDLRGLKCDPVICNQDRERKEQKKEAQIARTRLPWLSDFAKRHPLFSLHTSTIPRSLISLSLGFAWSTETPTITKMETTPCKLMKRSLASSVFESKVLYLTKWWMLTSCF